jgi:hypothetical protein
MGFGCVSSLNDVRAIGEERCLHDRWDGVGMESSSSSTASVGH